MNKPITRKKQQEISNIGLGAVSGGLMALGINSEETILRPFIGGINNFETIAMVLSIIMILVSIIYLSYKYKRQGKLYGFGIYICSFIGLYFILMSINLVYIIIGLIFLIISIELVAYSK